jgi:putative membrane protein
MKSKSAATAVAAASLALALAACGRGNETGSAADQQNEAINQAQDAASAVVGTTSAATVASTTVDGFVMEAANGDMYEIEAGKMALQRARNAEIKKIAQMIVDDHTASSTKLKSLISGGQVTGVTLPAAMDERHKGMIDNLRGATDQDFDNRWLDQQATAHREALTFLKGYQTAGQNEPLKAFAAEVEPKVQHHLDLISKVDRGQNPPSGGNTTGR